MAEVLPPKRQAVVDRLRRRIESYRRHQNDCIPRFDQSFNGAVEQNIQDTLVLKQRFLESKAKRAAKKSDKKPSDSSVQSNVHSLPKFTTKRSASEEAEGTGSEGFSEPPQKQPPPQPQVQQENLTKFSVEIVQQLEFTTSTTNSQISTNVTVKALNTSVKSDMPQSSSESPRPTTPRNPDIVECKQEPDNPEFVDLEQCAAALEKDAAANGGNSFPGFTDLIGDDTSDAIITSDAFKDLISEISDLNPEFMMKEFDFDGNDSKLNSDSHQFKAEESETKNPCSNSGRGGVQPPPQHRMGYNSGLDFAKAEHSPAAQTLKQMAEQHQHKTQLGMNFTPSRGANKSPYEYQFGGNSEFMNSTNSQQSFKQGINTSPCTFSTDNIKQEVFSGNQNSPVSFTGGGKIPSPQARLGAQFKQQYSPYGSPGAHGSPQYSGRSQNQQAPPQQPPRPPSGSTASLQVNQAQQLQITQNQGQQIQVSMAQNMSAELKNASNTGVSIASQQGIYMTGSQDSPGSSYCSVSQSQTINFTQQSLRQRTPQRQQQHQLIRTSHPGVEIVQPGQNRGGQQQMGMRPAPPEYSKGQNPNMLHSMMAPRFSNQPRMMPLQPMPPSGPMIRAQQGQYMTVGGSIVPGQVRLGPYGTRARQPTPVSDNDWRQMIIQPNRPQFHQSQGVTFASNNTQMSAGQMQHMSRVAQQQSLAAHHSNSQMSANIQMNQSMSSSTVFSTGNPRQLSNSQLPSYSASSYSPSQTVSSTYSGGYNQQSFSQHSSQHSSISPDFNLDFFEQIPNDNSSNFSEQELLSSLEPGTTFNLQDIL